MVYAQPEISHWSTDWYATRCMAKGHSVCVPVQGNLAHHNLSTNHTGQPIKCRWGGSVTITNYNGDDAAAVIICGQGVGTWASCKQQGQRSRPSHRSA